LQAQGLHTLLETSRLGQVLTEKGSTLFITPASASSNELILTDEIIIDDNGFCVEDDSSSDSCVNLNHPPDQFTPLPLPSPSTPTPHHAHSSQEGLFLTWQFVVLGIFFLILFFTFIGRILYTNLKHRWLRKLISTPKLLQEEVNELASGAGSSPPVMSLGSPVAPVAPSLSATLTTRKNAPSLSERSASMPARPANVLEKGNLDVDFSRSRAAASEDANSNNNINSNTATTTTLLASPPPATPPTIPPSPQIPSEIDGIPLVQYSRYSSEFTEMSALGRGGFGTVYKCTNTLDGREYAVKKIWIER